MQTSYIYIIANRLSGKMYIGKTINLEQRWKSHRSCKRTYIGRAIQKYGVPAFDFNVLEVLTSEEAAYEREKYWVSLYKSNHPDFGYNLESGGQGGKVASLVTRQKQAASHKGIPRPAHVIAALHAPEARKKAAQSRDGYKHSKETREKLSLAHLGKPKSPESIEKSAAGHRGKPLSSGHREKLSMALRGVLKTESHRQKISLAFQTPTEVIVRIRELSRNGLKQTEIAGLCNVGQSTVSRILRKAG